MAVSLQCLVAQNITNTSTEEEAVKTGDLCYTLTPDETWIAGAVWGNETINLDDDFEFEFEVNFGNKRDPNGADGIAFILAESPGIFPNSSGQNLGVSGISPSIHVEFDAFQNTGAGGFDDPSVNHIAIFRDGNGTHLDPNVCLSKKPNNNGYVQMHPAKPNVQDGNWYDVRITHKSATNELLVYFDNILRERLVLDISSTIFANKTAVYWGITASTGGESNVHRICFKQDTTSTKETEKKYVMPNAFTPSSYGLNDVFSIATSSDITVNRLMIYSRWGVLLHDGANSWDGKYKGEDVPNGVYLVIAELQDNQGSITKITGDVTVIK
jgi:gliding motility-associated-like protein